MPVACYFIEYNLILLYLSTSVIKHTRWDKQQIGHCGITVHHGRPMRAAQTERRKAHRADTYTGHRTHRLCSEGTLPYSHVKPHNSDVGALVSPSSFYSGGNGGKRTGRPAGLECRGLPWLLHLAVCF